MAAEEKATFLLHSLRGRQAETLSVCVGFEKREDTRDKQKRTDAGYRRERGRGWMCHFLVAQANRAVLVGRVRMPRGSNAVSSFLLFVVSERVRMLCQILIEQRGQLC